MVSDHFKENAAMTASRRSFLVNTGVLTTGLLVGLSPLAQAQKERGTLVCGTATPRVLNPAIQPGVATGLIGAQIFASLLQLDDQFRPLPYFAKSWEISKDKLTYTFHLVENAVFHDGKPITARDAAFSIEVVKANHPLLSVPFKQVIDSASAIDAHTLQIRLTKPFQGLLYTLVPILVPILPEHIYSIGPIRTNPANEKPIGSGPFKFAEWKAAEYIVLEKHDKFFRPGRPYLDRLVYKFMEDPLTIMLALENGTLDYFSAPDLRYSDIARLQNNPAVRVTRVGYEAMGQAVYLNMNMRDAPFNDHRFRQALAHSIDKDFIVKTLQHGVTQRLDGPLHPTNPFFDKRALTLYEYDLKLANKLLDDGGYHRKGGGMRMQLTLDTPPFLRDATVLVAQYLKSQLRNVGIDITLRPSTDQADWASRVGNWNYQFTMDGTWNYPDPAIGVNRLFLCDNIVKQIYTNTGGYCNKQVDEWLKTAMSVPDFEGRKVLYSEFQKQVTEDLPYIWTTTDARATVYKPGLKNIPAGVWGAMDPLDGVQWS